MRLSSHTAIKEIPVDKIRLVNTLKLNKDVHAREYFESMTGYKEAVLLDLQKQIKKLEGWVERVKSSEPVGISKEVPANCRRPENHTGDYEEIIDLMNWTTEEEIKLSTTDFNAYVRDNWDWQAIFKSTHSTYNSPE